MIYRSCSSPSSTTAIELTEHYPIRDYDVMRKAVQHYRAMGFSVAIDNLGADHSSLRLWSELRPDFVKTLAPARGAPG